MNIHERGRGLPPFLIPFAFLTYVCLQADKEWEDFSLKLGSHALFEFWEGLWSLHALIDRWLSSVLSVGGCGFKPHMVIYNV